MANTITTLTVEVGNLLSALEEVFARTASTKAYINFLGWELPPGLDDIGFAAVDFADFLEKLRVVAESSEAEWNDEILMAARIANLAVAMGKLVQEIHHLAETLPAQLAGHGDYISRTNIHKELPRRIVDLLIAGYLANRSTLIFSIFNLLNIVEFKHFDADEENFQVDHVRAIVHYDHIHSLFSDPATHMQKSYGWGTADFSILDLLTRIGQVLRAMGASIRLQPMDPRVEQALVGQMLPDAAAESSPQLNIHLYEELGAIAAQRVGLSVFGVRPSSQGASDGGIGFLPILRGQAAGAIPLHAFEDTFLEFSAEADLLQRIALILRPSRPLQVQRASSLGELADGRLALGIRHGRPDGEPKTLVTFPGGSALNMRQFALTGGVDKTAASTSESFLEMGLLGCQVIFSLSESDGFLSSAIPRDRIEASFDLRLGWTASRGIYFHGSGGLQVSLPLHLAVGPVRLESLTLGFDIKEEGFDVEASTSGALSIGPVTVTVDRLGLLVHASFGSGNLGLFDLSPRFKPPNGVGLAIDASVVVGGGYLRFDAQKQEYSGILQLEIAEKISVKAIGLLATRMPDGAKGYSLMVIISAEGFAPIQLGYGFTLTGIGGLLAINRTFDEAALRAGLKNHTLDSVMFPKDPIRNAPQILSNLNKVFPPANGHHLFGPMVQIAWGTPPLITADLAVVLEFGARLRLLILAQVVAILPKRENDLVRLQMDAIGVIDFDQGTAELDAALHDSRLLKKFVLTGDMAMRMKWEGSPNFALAIGGLHPAFNPPANFPKLQRIAINLSAGDNPRIRCEAYFALTANTVQFGARAELYAAAAGFSIHGEIAYDVLIQLDPFQFLADFRAQLQLKRGSSNLFKVRVEGALAGPRPLHIKAKATFEILWWDVSIRVDKTLVGGEKPPLPQPIDVLPRLKEALGNPGNWLSQLPDGQRPMVTLREKPRTATEVLLHPLGTLTVKQGIVPLDLDISRFGQAAPAGARRFTISSVSLGGQSQTTQPVKEFFAPAQFFEMSDDEKLSRPSFEPMAAGMSIGSQEFMFSADDNDWLEVEAIEFETITVDRDRKESRRSGAEDLYRLSAELFAKQARYGAAGASAIRRSGKAKYRATVGKHRIAKEGWSIVATDELTVQPIPGVEADKPVIYSEAAQALRKLKQQDPAKAGGLKILRLSELS